MIPDGEFSQTLGKDQRSGNNLQINTGKGLEDSFHSLDDGEPNTDKMVGNDMTTLEVLWFVTKLAVPMIFAMLIFMLV